MFSKFESYGISDVGLVRGNNEDVFAELPEYHFYVLADGMGGHKAGEIAAKEAVMDLCDSIDAFFNLRIHPTLDETKKLLKQAILQANTWVRNLAGQHHELSGMGTTLCTLLILDDQVIYSHLGDSRIYRFKEKLERLTQDHTVREENLSSVDGKKRVKTMITKAIGTSVFVDPEIKTRPLEAEEIYFLCTDGLTDCLSDAEIEQVLHKEKRIKEASIELVELAKKAGGHDNITILMIKNAS